MAFVKSIKVCSTLLKKGKKAGNKRGHNCDKTHLGSVQTHTPKYTRSCKQHVEIAHAGALKCTVNIGKGRRTAGVAFRCLSYLMLPPLS